MHLLDLQLRAYGGFTDRVLAFDSATSDGRGLHVVYGSNEAGKSTSMRAIARLLYGFPHARDDDYLHDAGDLRIGARIADAEGNEIEIVRRRGRKDTLLDTHGKPIGRELEERLAALLAGVDQTLFERKHHLDHHTLVTGASEMLSADGAAAETIFGAAGGVHGLHGVLRGLREEYDALLRDGDRTTKGEISKASRAYAEAQKELGRLRRNAARYQQLEQEQARVEAEIALLRGRSNDALSEASLLDRALQMLPLAAERAELALRRAAMGGAAPLGEEARVRREAAQEAIAEAAEVIEQAEREIAECHAAIEPLVICEPLLDRADDVRSLVERLGSYREARDRRPVAAARVEVEAQRLDTARNALGCMPGSDGVVDVTVPAAVRARVEELAGEHAGLQARLAERVLAAQHAADEVATAESALIADGGLVDVEELSAAIELAAGVLGHELRQAEQGCRELAASVRTRVRRLPLWGDDATSLRDATLPLRATIERHRAALAAMEERERKLDAEREQVERAIAKIDEELAARGAPEGAAAQGRLEAARGERSSRWQRIRTAWMAGEPGTEVHADEFEAALAACDDASEALLDVARSDAEGAALMTRRARDAQHLAHIQKRAGELRADREKALDSWRREWHPCGVDPLSPGEMLQWLAERDAIVADVERLEAEQRRVHERDLQVASRLDRLRTALRAAGVAPAGDLAPEQVVETARARRDALLHQRDAARLARQALEAARRAGVRAASAVEETEADGRAWQSAWADTMPALGLPPHATVLQARATLAAFDDLTAATRAYGQAVQEQRELETITHSFEEAVGELAASIDLERMPLESLPADITLKQIAATLVASQRNREQLTVLNERHDAARGRRDAAQSRRARAQAQLDALCAEAGVSNVDHLPAAEHAAAELRQLDARIAEVDGELRIQRPGQSVESILAWLAELDPDTLPQQAQNLRQAAAADESTLRALAATRDEIVYEVRQIATSEREQELRAELEHQRATIERLTARYVPMRLAAELLERAIDDYRREHQGPVMERAAAIFAQLTCGAYEGIDDAFDGDELVLVGVRSGGRPVRVHAMSDGTRDQLYLALRIASLHHDLDAARHEPMPLVVDDILIAFDDERASATMQVLAQLAERTQVLFFTHHRRLVELAEEHVPAGLLGIHELSPVLATA